MKIIIILSIYQKILFKICYTRNIERLQFSCPFFKYFLFKQEDVTIIVNIIIVNITTFIISITNNAFL